ncbi:efflux RND transporter periplasmic adaptor subunit [Spirosoma sp. RP8]|uniref:Efflux RND transporter periplasmic adaptor subunit n=1 Tax=Spirosoma liriopis TaxID=2937440 RepID=A0ABT0HV23_9BACT|nr:efflux RND transporter periplasmic adaptor subunit [Spirosoma liriopis]MCK8496003.1 efflux RND transporter periplasmic adaptor subunit [Spirosoma liriopis]
MTYKLYAYSLLTVLIIVVAAGCRSTDNQGSKERTNQATATEPTNDSATAGPIQVSLTQAQYNVAAIQLGQPTVRTLHSTLKATGTIDVPASNLVSVAIPFGGYIRKIDLEPGMKVRKGQPLVQLENPDFIQLQQDYLDTKAKLEFADLDFVRQQELSRENVNALKVFQQVRASRQSLQAQLAGMSQRLAMMHIEAKKLSPNQLTRVVTIPSPVSGFVTKVPVNNGRFLNPSDVLVEITNVDHLHVQLNIYEKDISRIHAGQRVRFSLGGDSSYVHQGEIFLIGKAIAADRTITVLAHPDGYAADFIPGGYVSALIEVQTQPLPTLPESAVVRYGGKSLVYVLAKKYGNPTRYQFQQVEVQTAVRENGYVAVTLPAGIDPAVTPIVINGAYSLLAKLNNSEDE